MLARSTSEYILSTGLEGTSFIFVYKTIWTHPAGKTFQIKICKIPLRKQCPEQQWSTVLHFAQISISFMPAYSKIKPWTISLTEAPFSSHVIRVIEWLGLEKTSKIT